MRKKTIAILVCFTAFSAISFGAEKNKLKPLNSSKKRVKTEITTETVPYGFYVNVWNKYQNGSEKDKKEAIESLRSVIAKNFQETKAHCYLGIMYYEAGEYSMALTYFQNALPGYEKSADIYTRIGETHYKLGNKEEAKNTLLYALSLEPDIPSALSILGEYAYDDGNYDEATERLSMALELDEKNLIAILSLGKICLLKTNYNAAIEILSKAEKLYEDNSEIELYLGLAYDMSKKYKQSVEHLSKALKSKKDEKKYLLQIGYSLAKGLFEIGEYDQAEKAYKKSMKLMENKSEGYFGLGLVYEAKGDIENAVKAFVKAYKLDTKYSEKIEEYGAYYAEEGEYSKALRLYDLLHMDYKIKQLEKKIAANKKEEEKIEKQADYELSAKASNATDHDIEYSYLALFELDNDNAEAALNLMNFYKDRGYYDKALTWFKKYNKLNPTSDYNRKLIEQDLKEKLENDNRLLYGKPKSKKSKGSNVSDDELYNIAFRGDNDRLRECALKLLVTRKDYKENIGVYEEMLDFYEKRGNKKEALKCISKMKSLGLISDSEAAYKQSRIKLN